MIDAHAKAVEAAANWYQYEMSSSREDAAYFASAVVTAYLAAMRAEGWVMVPREPTLEMLQDGYDAGRKAYHNGISGMTIDAQIRAQSHREAAIYRAMIEAAMLKGAGDEG